MSIATSLHKNIISTIGIIIAVIGITLCGVSMYHKDPIKKSSAPQKKFSFSITFSKTKAVEEAPPPQKITTTQILRYSGGGLGIVALIFGLIAFLKKEYSRAIGVTILLGGIALAWEFFLIVIAIGAIGTLLANS